MASDFPYFPFYASDWLSSAKLRSCSLAARGMWVEMLSLMHKSDRRGYLQIGGSPVNAEQLARMTGCSTDEATRLLAELLNSGVPSVTDDGIFYSKRMVKGEQKRRLCSAAGKKGGGNPVLRKGVKGTFKGHSKGGVKGGVKGTAKGASDSGSDSSSGKGGAGEGKRGGPTFAEVAATWNAVDGVRHCRGPTKARAASLRERCRDPAWVAGWREAILRVSASDFCRGGGSQGWVADIDWFLSPSAVTKILEGKYDDRHQRNGQCPTQDGTAAAYTPEQLEEIQRRAREEFLARGLPCQ